MLTARYEKLWKAATEARPTAKKGFVRAAVPGRLQVFPAFLKTKNHFRHGGYPSGASSARAAQVQTRAGTKRREEHWCRAGRSRWRRVSIWWGGRKSSMT